MQVGRGRAGFRGTAYLAGPRDPLDTARLGREKGIPDRCGGRAPRAVSPQPVEKNVRLSTVLAAVGDATGLEVVLAGGKLVARKGAQAGKPPGAER